VGKIKVMGKRLNLGCGNNILPGFVNLDISPGPGVDVVFDLSKDLKKHPLPFKDGEFSLVLASHVLEHLDDTIGVMAEIYRVLRPGGVAIIRFPYYLHPNAWVDPTHKKCLTEDTFRYFTAEFSKKQRVIEGRYPHNPVKGERLFRQLSYRYVPTWAGKLVYPFIRWLRHFCAILIREVEVRLVK
jgi:SAM-dependent methyltransferase